MFIVIRSKFVSYFCRCTTGSCIPKNWECDREFDCTDSSDEHEGCSKCKNIFIFIHTFSPVSYSIINFFIHETMVNFQ